LPTSPLDFSNLKVFLKPGPSATGSNRRISEWRNALDNKPVFSQSQPEHQPLLDLSPSGAPVLLFSGSSLQSSLTPQHDATFTLVTYLKPTAKEADKQASILVGVDPKAEGTHKFLIRNDPNLAYSYIFETEKGSALLTLPLEERDKPIFLAFRRSAESDRGYLGTNIADLSNSPPIFPETLPDRFPGLQLGGIEQDQAFYYGWIGDFIYFTRALSDRELEILAKLLKEKYGDHL
jgi:hypothetical protein